MAADRERGAVGGLTLLALLAVLLVAVGALAWWSLDRRAPVEEGFDILRTDPVLGHVMRSGFRGRQVSEQFDVAVRTNALGLRDDEVVLPKPEGTYRIVVLGDSISFGFGVEEAQAYPALLERRLRERGLAVDVVNAGVPGWSPDHEYLWLRQIGYDLEPDLVLLQIGSSDLGDLMRARLVLGPGNLPVAIHSAREVEDPGRAERLAELASQMGLDLDLSDPERLAREADDPAVERQLRQLFRREEELREADAGAPPEGPLAQLPREEVARGLRTGGAFQARYLRYLLGAIQADCAARAVALRVLMVHGHVNVLGEDEQRLTRLCTDLGGGCLDSLGFVTPEEAEDLFFTHDAHWRPPAHERAAQAIEHWLLDDPELALSRRGR